MSSETTTTSVRGQAESLWDVVTRHTHSVSTVGAHLSAGGEPRGTTERRGFRAGARGIIIDALRAGQAWPVIAVHEGMSPASRRLRYGTPTPLLTPRMVRVLTDLRPGHHEAYAAWRGGHPIGIVRWIRTPDTPDAAELAIEVVDAEQAAGVGRALAAFATVRAWRAGVRTMVVWVDPGNVRIRGWLDKLRARALPCDADQFALPIQALCAALLVAHP